MAYSLNECMLRLPPIQKAALAALSPAVNCDAVAYWPYQQEVVPYWWNRVEGMVTEPLLSQDAEIHTYTIAMALVIGHLTEGYRGDVAEKAYTWIVQILDYFRARPKLTSTDYPNMPDSLWIEDGGARIIGIPNGTRTLANSGTEQQQIAVVFSLELPLIWYLY